MDFFGDSAAILDYVVSNSYYGMPKGQISIYLPPKNSKIAIWNNIIQIGRRIAEKVHCDAPGLTPKPITTHLSMQSATPINFRAVLPLVFHFNLCLIKNSGGRHWFANNIMKTTEQHSCNILWCSGSQCLFTKLNRRPQWGAAFNDWCLIYFAYG